MSQAGIVIVGVISLLGALVSGCSIQVQESELYGVYVAEYESGTEKLTLHKEGRYIQEVSLKGSQKPTINSGVWKYDPSRNRVEMEGCFGVGDGFGKIRPDFAAKRGVCSFPVGRRWFVVGQGQLRLGPDEASPLWKVE